jgi:hypothetical protein
VSGTVVLASVLTGCSLVFFLIAWYLRRPRILILLGIGSVVVASVLAALDPGPGSVPETDTLIVLMNGLLAVAGGGPITTMVFGLVEGESDDNAPGPIRRAGDILRGGALIGALERAAIFGSLIAGWPEGLALVLGLKGLGRYPELRNQDNTGTAERFIIGTFSSALWACACAATAMLTRHAGG